MANENLWGELPTAADIKPPIVILREQAAKLSEATNKILIGGVSVSKNGQRVDLDLYIQAPALDNYVYIVLTVQHGILLYPLIVIDVAKGMRHSCSNEDQFQESLRQILSSREVHGVVASLLAQSKAE